MISDFKLKIRETKVSEEMVTDPFRCGFAVDFISDDRDRIGTEE